MQRGVKATKWQSMITKKTYYERAVICHKLAINEGAPTMMCGRNEEPWPSVTTCWKIATACACCRVMDTCCL